MHLPYIAACSVYRIVGQPKTTILLRTGSRDKISFEGKAMLNININYVEIHLTLLSLIARRTSISNNSVKALHKACEALAI
jgi:DNA-binding CsgD family transcriptional regulator